MASEKNKRGRPRSQMTDEAIEAILRTVRLGLHPNRAAAAHGISPATMRSYRKRHPEFADAVGEAEAFAEKGFLARIMKHTEKNWTAAAWMLERRWPKRWARRDPDIVAAAKVHATAKPGPTPPPVESFKDYIVSLSEAVNGLGIGQSDDTNGKPA